MAKRADNWRRRKPFVTALGSDRNGKDAGIDFNSVVDAMMSNPALLRELDEKIARAVQSHAPKPLRTNK
jgi:hypothetical protein